MKIFFVMCLLAINMVAVSSALAVCNPEVDTHANYIQCRFAYLNCLPALFYMDMEKIATVYLEKDQTSWKILMNNGAIISTDGCSIIAGNRPWEPYRNWIEFIKKNPKYMRK